MDAAAFASLRSLADMIRNIKFRNSKGVPPFFYRQQIDEFEVQVLDLQKYLEDLEPELRKKIEMEISISKIPDIVSTAKGTIDFHVVDQIIHLIEQEQGRHSEGEAGEWKGLYSLSHSLPHNERSRMISSFGKALQPVMTDVKNIKEKLVGTLKDALALCDSSSEIHITSPDSIIPPSPIEGAKIVGFEERVDKLKDLLYLHEKALKVVAIYGMGGIGKTTLARTVYDDPSIAGRFDKCIWITVSQRCDVRSILQGVLNDKETMEIRELGTKLYQELKCRRYLMVMDDIWSVADWEQLRMYLPKESEGSRIVVTTRELKVAHSLCESVTLLQIGFLNLDQSWKLLYEKAFGSSSRCPSEDHKKIGREIAKSCDGLPLSIVVIAGLLSKSDKTIEYWNSVAKNVSKLVTREDHGRCLKILSFSYENLPLHLKPCFLYMGSFKEDEEVRVKDLTRKWICAGLIKPEGNKTMDDIAKTYVMELIDRNMVLVAWKQCDDIRRVRVHDLMLQLCVLELEKLQKFKNVILDSSSYTWEGVACDPCQQIRGVYRLYDIDDIDNFDGDDKLGDQMDLCMGIHQVRDLRINDRPLVSECTCVYSQPDTYNSEVEPRPSILKLPFSRDIDNKNQLLCKLSNFSSLPLCLFWNTCIIDDFMVSPRTIWDLPLLQKWSMFTNPELMIPNQELMNPLMEKLQEFSGYDLEFTRKFVECTPNLICLKYHFDQNLALCRKSTRFLRGKKRKSTRFDNIQHWNKLEKLHISQVALDMVNIKYPQSLIELKFRGCSLYTHSEFAALPNLKKLILSKCNVGHKWSMRGVKFQKLEFLEIEDCNPKYKCEWRWIGKEENFPQLKFLVLTWEKELESLSVMREIETLNSIYIISCCDRVVESAKLVIRDQRRFGNEALKLYIDHKLYAFKDEEEENEEEEEKEEYVEEDKVHVIYNMELWNSSEESISRLLGYSPDVLVLDGCCFNWNQGQLATTTFSHLKRLTLIKCKFEHEWNAERVEFLQLQHLVITGGIGCPSWKWKASHFPQLQSLSINDQSLLMIPLYMSNVTTLIRIHLGAHCSKGVEESAKIIFKLKKKDAFRLTVDDNDYKEGGEEVEEDVEEYKLDVICWKRLWNSNEESIRALLGFSPNVLVFECSCFNWNQEQLVSTTFSHLKRLTLSDCGFAPEWNVERVEFLQLQYLNIDTLISPKWEWKGKASNFPKLRSLFIKDEYLKGIPLDMSKITTLVRIHLNQCSEGVKESAIIIFKLKGKDTLRLTIDNNDYKECEEEEDDYKECEEEEDNVEEYKFDVIYEKELWNSSEESISEFLGFSPNALVFSKGCFNWNQEQLVTTTFSHLKRLNLSACKFAPKWNVERVEFVQLQYLNFSNHSDGPWEWKGKSSNFPKLRSLFIKDKYLKVIPLDMSEITTLVRIHLLWCSEEVEESAKTIFMSKEKDALRLTINKVDYKEEVGEEERKRKRKRIACIR